MRRAGYRLAHRLESSAVDDSNDQPLVFGEYGVERRSVADVNVVTFEKLLAGDPANSLQALWRRVAEIVNHDDIVT